MPRPRPLHLLKERNRYGTVVWYVRIGKGQRVRIRGEYGSAEFNAAYRAAIAGEAPQRGPHVSQGSLAWLIARYRDSGAWARLSDATRRQRDNTFARLPTCEIAQVSKKAILDGLDRRRATPFAARDFLKTMRGLFKWAKESDLVKIDPTDGISSPLPRTEGFHTWTEEEITRFEARWPIGSRERLALSVLLYTGLRRGDAAALGRQHMKDGVIMLRTGKTGQQIVIPVLADLATAIAATKTGDLAFIATERGAPMTKESFGNWFRSACRAAGVPGSAHGLRKAGATRAANNGATVAQLEAIYGWSGGGMASLYTRAADRVRLAREAMGKLGGPGRDEKESGTK
jgi:integrase